MTTQESSPPLTATTTTTTVKPRLLALDGFRFIVAFWLVVAHNFNNSALDEGTYYQRFCMRRYVAVTFFLVTSGFCLQYAHGSKDFQVPHVLHKYLWNRFGSILACYYATTAVALVVRGLGHHYTVRQWLVGIPLVTTLLQCWVPHYQYFGNTPAWTISTLAAHWLAFPWFLQARLLQMRDKSLVYACVVIPILAVVPISITLWIQSGLLHSSQQWLLFYTFPPLRFAEFVLGAVLAELLVRGYYVRPKLLARLADLVFPLVFLLILAVPYSSRTTAYDSILMYATMPLFGLLLFGSSIDNNNNDTAVSCCCWTGRFFSLAACRRLGEFALPVYLWRWPLFAIVARLQDGQWNTRGYLYLSPLYFVPSFFGLYGFAYLWHKHVDRPLRLHLLGTKLLTTNNDKQPQEQQELGSEQQPQQEQTAVVPSVVPPPQQENNNDNDESLQQQPYTRMV